MTAPLIPPVPPGSTPLREMARAIATALALPRPATTRDELTYLRIARNRARLVQFAMQRIIADREIENDPGDVMAAVTTLREQVAELCDDGYDHAPEPS
jgi:hypothetical protein